MDLLGTRLSSAQLRALFAVTDPGLLRPGQAVPESPDRFASSVFGGCGALVASSPIPGPGMEAARPKAASEARATLVSAHRG